jgi:hypothetical protein
MEKINVIVLVCAKTALLSVRLALHLPCEYHEGTAWRNLYHKAKISMTYETRIPSLLVFS